MDKSNDPKEKIAPRRRVMEVVEIEDDGKNSKPVEPQKQEENLKKVSVENPPPVSPFIKEELPVVEKTPEEKKDLVNELFHQKEEEPPRASFGYPDISAKSKKGSPSLLVWAILVIVLIGIIGGALLLYKNNAGSGNVLSLSPIGKPSPTLSPAPTIEPTPTVDRSKIIIQVLNGSGKAGVASKMKTLLEEKGYTVSETGNAKKYDYPNTEIHVIPEKEAYIDIIKTDLSGDYTIGSTSATLDTTASYSARVIIGKE